MSSKFSQDMPRLTRVTTGSQQLWTTPVEDRTHHSFLQPRSLCDWPNSSALLSDGWAYNAAPGHPLVSLSKETSYSPDVRLLLAPLQSCHKRNIVVFELYRTPSEQLLCQISANPSSLCTCWHISHKDVHQSFLSPTSYGLMHVVDNSCKLCMS